jgi:anti-anti-sigma factor
VTKLRVDTQSDGDLWRLNVAGELDVATVDQLSARLTEPPPGATVILDLGSLMFIDSSGLRAILQAHLGGRRLRLANPRPEILRVLEIADVLDLFPIEEATSLPRPNPPT